MLYIHAKVIPYIHRTLRTSQIFEKHQFEMKIFRKKNKTPPISNLIQTHA
jgi:hypothetical protein